MFERAIAPVRAFLPAIFRAFLPAIAPAFVAFFVLVTTTFAQPTAVPEPETLAAPTPARLATILSAAQRDGWAPQTVGLRAAALHAYERDKLPAAEAWLHVAHWAALFGQPEGEFTLKWMRDVQEARVNHPNMPPQYALRSTLLGAAAAPDFQAWLLGNEAFSDEFFSLVAPVDYLPRVLEILNDLYHRDPVRFKAYANLALAIAVVYDVPPPPNWPHAQVGPEALPRKLPAPADAFNWWIKQEQIGRTYHRLQKLPADELKFVVDAAAPFAELEWSQSAADVPLGNLAAAYGKIRYRTDRLAKNQPIWPGGTYTLKDILTTGGICADQAYFATEVGKARGVPTLLIYGAGNDARHAWFGFLDGNGQWQLDAGRYAEQRFVTGYARDPQTWREFSDHELRFLSEHFRALPSFRQSRVHEDFATEYLASGAPAQAAVAARKAVNYERRNQAGWETLVAAAHAEHRDAKTIEAVLHEAALAFQRYPDLEAMYIKRAADSLRARGETSAAEAEVRHIALKNQTDRSDISVEQARDAVLRAIATLPLEQQVRAYNSAVDNYGRHAGIAFFDQVVTVFVEHLVQLQQWAEASRALDRARHTLQVDPHSQLESEFTALAKTIQPHSTRAR